MDSYNEHAEQYAALIRSRDQWGFSPYLDLVVPALLRVVGEIRGKRVLDACCGDGFLTRQLADRGAHVVGVDISPNLIALARQVEAQEERKILYLSHDLTRPLPQYAGHLDVITCNLALNDVVDACSFIENLGDMLRPCGLLAISMNNPYSAVMRKKVQNYFDSGQSEVYSGLAAAGVRALYHHRTMEEYFHEFRRNGLYLGTLLDVKPSPEHLASGSPRPRQYYQFPFFMVLALTKLEP
jgi:2-polyprenyl-3-methyl-5-hydroxy-6-metoxy-1,4-benzoquinol methylase